jgi:putative redox protein
MIMSKVKYVGGLRTEAIHLASGNKIVTDAPVDNKGKGEAFSPTDLLSTSLACCMLTIMGITGNTHGINIDGTEAEVTKIMGANPRKVAEVHIKFTMPASNYSDKEKAILENAARTCPVALSINPSIIQKIEFVYAG